MTTSEAGERVREAFSDFSFEFWNALEGAALLVVLVSVWSWMWIRKRVAS